MTNPFASLVRHEIARLRARRFGRLRFPHQLEARFEGDNAYPRSRRLLIEGRIMGAVFFGLIFADLHIVRSRFEFSFLVRCFFVVPMMLFAHEVQRRNPRKLFREGTVVLTATVVAWSNFVIYHDFSAPITASAQIGALIALLVTNVVMRVRFPFALASASICVFADTLFLLTDNRLAYQEKLACGIPFLWGTALILLAAYSLERQERLAYVLQFSNELQSNQLSDLNIELARISSQDALTGLANRAAFDHHLETLWKQAIQSSAPLSAVLVDIDHFKIVNDTQGHLYGDEVIKRVAALLQQSLRGKLDFAARFGGEEFVLLLPDTTLDAAVLIAERLRTLIQLAGSPAPAHPVPQPGLWTTVSCGVATINAVAHRVPNDLVHAADLALYAAKSNGRNCVCTAPAIGSAAARQNGVSRLQTAEHD